MDDHSPPKKHVISLRSEHCMLYFQSTIDNILQRKKKTTIIIHRCRFLLGTGLEQDINIVDNRGCSALHELLSLVNRRVSSFHHQAAPPSDTEHCDQTTFDQQVLDSLHLLLSNNCDANLVNTSGLTALHKLILLHDYTTSHDGALSGVALETLPPRAAYKVDFSLVHRCLLALLEHGRGRVDVNEGTSAGRTPLVMLLQSTLNVDPGRIGEYASGYLQCIETLCKHGARPSYSAPTHIAVVTTLFKFGQKCLAERDEQVQATMSTFVQVRASAAIWVLVSARHTCAYR